MQSSSSQTWINKVGNSSFITAALQITRLLPSNQLHKGRVQKFMLGKLVDFPTKAYDVMWIVGGLEVSESILVH